MKKDYVKFEIWNEQEIFTEIGTYCYKHGAEQPILIHKDNERYSSFYGRRYAHGSFPVQYYWRFSIRSSSLIIPVIYRELLTKEFLEL